MKSPLVHHDLQLYGVLTFQDLLARHPELDASFDLGRRIMWVGRTKERLGVRGRLHQPVDGRAIEGLDPLGTTFPTCCAPPACGFGTTTASHRTS